LIKAQDCVKVDIASGKITDYIKFESGNVCMVIGGRNLGRVGIIMHREKHPGSFDIVHVKDAAGHSFATRLNYIFTIGKGAKPWVSIPEGKGIRMTVAEERDKRLAAKTT
jgi:small subunit ribosomal protein S4e